MKIYYQKLSNENGVVVIKNLIRFLGVSVSEKALAEVKQNHGYPSLDSLANVLSDWNIENMGVRLSVNQLAEIPYPAIAHLNKNNGHFIVLQKLVDDLIHYVDPEEGQIIESLEDFEKKWSGVVLLVQATEKSSEENYKEKRSGEIFNEVTKYFSVVLLGLAIMSPVFLWAGISYPLYFIKALGLAFCFILFQKQSGSKNPYVTSFCKLGSKSDCDAVIHSPASRLFGLIHLSEPGVLYFFGSILLLVLSGFSSQPATGVLVILNVLVLPFSIFSVYYQWRVIKKWCPLCLIVMGIFWIEFSLLWPSFSMPGFSATGLYLAFLGFSMPLAFWLAVRERFIDSFKVPALERSLIRFKKSAKIFKALLDQEAEVNIGELTSEIQTGSENPQVELTVVSNPTCGPCSYAHRVIEELVERYNEKLRVRFRFTINTVDTSSDTAKMVRHIAALSLTNSNGHAVKSLSAWFSQNGRTNLNKWKEDHPVETVNENEVDLVLREHEAWCKQVNIQATPTIFVNGKKLPPEYTVGDLKYHVRYLIEQIS
jgi:uncharacterized membrane protein